MKEAAAWFKKKKFCNWRVKNKMEQLVDKGGRANKDGYKFRTKIKF